MLVSFVLIIDPECECGFSYFAKSTVEQCCLIMKDLGGFSQPSYPMSTFNS